MVNQPNDINPLVSVVMPAYKAAYLKEALQSLQDQTYRPLELVICDDCRTDEVRAVVDEYRGILDFPVHYSYNETRLHESKNLAKCVSLASGEYLKFLYDDDVLHPECVERMVDAMRERPGIELVSSRRRRIDDQGRQLPDILATALPFVEDALVDGIGLTSFLAGVARTVIDKNVTINNMLPGKLDTDRLRGPHEPGTQEDPDAAAARKARISADIPAKRLGTPEEFGRICAFLCSVHAGYLTGQNIPVDGGLYVSAF